ncbi:single-stranded-DNA-specific exonuclease RecJ [Clostridium sp. MD294]|uniref:single-stranded-DNA-specific exonuclease RecJ n=1 Tax=Clostridium sp. MD294 TaxID=97138 RepID=UPI0002CB53FE|nr:single-stranded-DNA-specific exonuclease RecJ [Clostridium sp. MD294]NDO47722.1 single-stranded-DNA-specific exonuclease RecJ [Clostridium sp. MD294]USF29960.1 Single-stranded-DNA-specific exonuclease RecJ [Clostridium sp. MD294]
MENRWILKRTKADINKMSEVLDIRQATACVLANREIKTKRQAVAFLKAENAALYDVLEQNAMKDAQKAMELLEEAVTQHYKIAIYGDYDVDGVTSTAIWYKVLCYCGADVIYYIPHRQKEGYGLNLEAIEELHKKGIQLLLTCDNGIAAIEEIEKAKEFDMTVVIIDHHEAAFDECGNDILPKADAIVDPKQKQCQYPFKMLCAGGLCYKLALLFLKRLQISNEILERECLHLATLATVCDIVDLMEENRIIVKKGLKTMPQTTNIGLKSLLEQTNLYGKELTEYHIGFMIGPCVNAAGRLETAKTAVALFCENDEKKAKEYAQYLIEQNNSRKDMTQKATEQVIKEIEQKNRQNEKVLVIYQKNVHESIAGIVAGRIKEKFYRPTILITQSENMAKGSGRSIEGYNMFEELYACKELFVKFGGHTMAAGLSLPYENIQQLQKRLECNCKLTQQQLLPVLKIEKQLNFEEIDITLAEELRNLAPFGKGNHVPLFGSKNIKIVKYFLIGKEKNIIKMILEEQKTGIQLNGISFDGYDKFLEMIKQLYGQENCDKMLANGYIEQNMDFVYSVNINTFRGENSVQLQIKDFRVSQQ